MLKAPRVDLLNMDKTPWQQYWADTTIHEYLKVYDSINDNYDGTFSVKDTDHIFTSFQEAVDFVLTLRKLKGGDGD